MLTYENLNGLPQIVLDTMGIVSVDENAQEAWINDSGAASLLGVQLTTYRRHVDGDNPNITDVIEVDGERAVSLTALTAFANRPRRRGNAITYIVRIPDDRFVEEYKRLFESGSVLIPREMVHREAKAKELEAAGIPVPANYLPKAK